MRIPHRLARGTSTGFQKALFDFQHFLGTIANPFDRGTKVSPPRFEALVNQRQRSNRAAVTDRHPRKNDRTVSHDGVPSDEDFAVSHVRVLRGNRRIRHEVAAEIIGPREDPHPGRERAEVAHDESGRATDVAVRPDMNMRLEMKWIRHRCDDRHIAIDADVILDRDVFQTDDRAIFRDSNIVADAFEAEATKFEFVVVAVLEWVFHANINHRFKRDLSVGLIRFVWLSAEAACPSRADSRLKSDVVQYEI